MYVNPKVEMRLQIFLYVHWDYVLLSTPEVENIVSGKCSLCAYPMIVLH